MELFSIRNGFQVKKEIQIESMDQDLRIQLWNIFHKQVLLNILRIEEKSHLIEDLDYMYGIYFKLPLHEPYYLNSFWDIDSIIITDHFFSYFKEDKWFNIFELFEFILNSSEKLNAKISYDVLIKNINIALQSEKSGYRLVDNFFSKIIDVYELKSIEEALNTDEKMFNPGKIHLKQAFRHLCDKRHPDYKNSIKESICSIESACKNITNKQNASLGEALNFLKKNDKTNIHKGLNSAFDKLYGYTCSENGIRHALFDENDNVTFDEAKFMLVACCAFFNYLKSKSAEL
jgi:AbiJ N-terminal domain 4